MIVDLLRNAKWYYATGKKLAAGLQYLEQTDFSVVAPGRYDIDGDNVFALVQEYETKLQARGRIEAHRKYIDIQYIVSGVERMGYAPTALLRVSEEYDEAKDVLFLRGSHDFVAARAGMFLVFGPEDAHMPGIALTSPQPVKKVVVKVVVD